MGDSKKTIRFSKKTIRFRNDNDGNVYSRSGVSSDPVNRRAAVQIVHDRRFVSTVQRCREAIEPREGAGVGEGRPPRVWQQVLQSQPHDVLGHVHVAGCHAFRIVQGARAECSLYCAHQRQAGKEGPMLFCNVSSILLQYRTQRFSVYGWARAHPSKSQRDRQDHLQNTSYWNDKPTGFQMSAHCTQPSSQQATVLADVPKHACFPLDTAPKTAAPGLASSLDSPTVGVMSAQTAR